MIATKPSLKEKTKTTPKEEIYWVPVTQVETRIAKIKVAASSPKEATARAKSIVSCLTGPTIMAALGEVEEADIGYGKPWQPETIPADTCPPVEVVEKERRKA